MLRTRRLHGGCNHFSRGHLEVTDQALGPVPLVLELPTLLLARLHRLSGSDPFQRLDARHLIDTDRVRAFLRQLTGRLQVAGTNALPLLLERLRVSGLRIEPITTAVGLEFGCILKNARRVGRKSTRRCRVG